MALIYDPDAEGYVESTELDDHELADLLTAAGEDPAHPQHALGRAFLESADDDIDFEEASEDEVLEWAQAVATDPDHPNHEAVVEALEAGLEDADFTQQIMESAGALQDRLGRSLTHREIDAIATRAEERGDPDAETAYVETVGDRDLSTPSERRRLADEVAESTLADHGQHSDNSGGSQPLAADDRPFRNDRLNKALEVANSAFEDHADD